MVSKVQQLYTQSVLLWRGSQVGVTIRLSAWSKISNTCAQQSVTVILLGFLLSPLYPNNWHKDLVFLLTRHNPKLGRFWATPTLQGDFPTTWSFTYGSGLGSLWSTGLCVYSFISISWQILLLSPCCFSTPPLLLVLPLLSSLSGLPEIQRQMWYSLPSKEVRAISCYDFIL